MSSRLLIEQPTGKAMLVLGTEVNEEVAASWPHQVQQSAAEPTDFTAIPSVPLPDALANKGEGQVSRCVQIGDEEEVVLHRAVDAVADAASNEVLVEIIKTGSSEVDEILAHFSAESSNLTSSNKVCTSLVECCDIDENNYAVHYADCADREFEATHDVYSAIYTKTTSQEEVVATANTACVDRLGSMMEEMFARMSQAKEVSYESFTMRASHHQQQQSSSVVTALTSTECERADASRGFNHSMTATAGIGDNVDFAKLFEAINNIDARVSRISHNLDNGVKVLRGDISGAPNSEGQGQPLQCIRRIDWAAVSDKQSYEALRGAHATLTNRLDCTVVKDILFGKKILSPDDKCQIESRKYPRDARNYLLDVVRERKGKHALKKFAKALLKTNQEDLYVILTKDLKKEDRRQSTSKPLKVSPGDNEDGCSEGVICLSCACHHGPNVTVQHQTWTSDLGMAEAGFKGLHSQSQSMPKAVEKRAKFQPREPKQPGLPADRLASIPSTDEAGRIKHNRESFSSPLPFQQHSFRRKPAGPSLALSSPTGAPTPRLPPSETGPPRPRWR